MKEGFIKFLVDSKKKGYAAGELNIVCEEDQSFSTRREEGDFSFHDNWFGGEPFGGREVVLYMGKPYWMMVYYGQDSGRAPGVIDFLREALSRVDEALPLRGPKNFNEGGFRYENIIEGDLKKFVGVERIFRRDDEVFRTNYAGGLVDQRKDQ